VPTGFGEARVGHGHRLGEAACGELLLGREGGRGGARSGGVEPHRDRGAVAFHYDQVGLAVAVEILQARFVCSLVRAARFASGEIAPAPMPRESGAHPRWVSASITFYRLDDESHKR
jgi:hypothetical protein